MTEPHDGYRRELLQAVEKLNELAALLKWLEPSLRGEISNAWHICSAATWMVTNRRRELEGQLRDDDDLRARTRSLGV